MSFVGETMYWFVLGWHLGFLLGTVRWYSRKLFGALMVGWISLAFVYLSFAGSAEGSGAVYGAGDLLPFFIGGIGMVIGWSVAAFFCEEYLSGEE